MNTNSPLRFFGVLVLLSGLGCSSEPSTQALRTEEDLAKLSPILEGIARAKSLTLYEGLPHQDSEKEAFEKELANKKTVQLHGFPFYEQPLSVDSTDMETLREISKEPGNYESIIGAKSCGGFHPDYCLVWIDGAKKYELLICLGCGDMDFHDANKGYVVWLTGNAEDEFRAALKAYRSQRPIPWWEKDKAGP